MNVKEYILEKTKYILLFMIYHVFLYIFLLAMQIASNEIWLLILMNTGIGILYMIYDYQKHKKVFIKIDQLMDKLQEKYLISEVIKKPKTQVEQYYYELLKKANKSMIEEVNKVKNSQKEYKEYIESWIHEIKIPITSAMLLCENNKSLTTRKIYIQLEEINNFVEQVLFFARKENVSSDYIIQKTVLNRVIDSVISRNKQLFNQEQIQIHTSEKEVTAYTDEKWLEFIINQILMNCIKYKNKRNADIVIDIEEKEKQIEMSICDNGMGIKESDIGRVFEKGFTGSNGRKIGKKSTGIGLYLCKNLCEKLGMNIQIESKENEYTKVILYIPKSQEWQELQKNRNLTKF